MIWSSGATKEKRELSWVICDKVFNPFLDERPRPLVPASKTGSGLFALLPQPQNKTTTRRPLEYVHFLFLPTESWFFKNINVTGLGVDWFRPLQGKLRKLITVGTTYRYIIFILSFVTWFQRIQNLDFFGPISGPKKVTIFRPHPFQWPL